MSKILISHRGNLSGINEPLENNPDYIDKAILLGYEVEVDVWYVDGKYYLGHDIPQYHVEEEYLKNKKLWCHAKNYEALTNMLNQNIHCFWHESDTVTLTSKGYIWANLKQQPLEGSIAIMPERNNEDVSSCLGICSDFIENYRDKK